jgi:hypothetical protein
MTYGNGGGCGGLVIFCGAVDVRSLVGDGVGWIDGEDKRRGDAVVFLSSMFYFYF